MGHFDLHNVMIIIIEASSLKDLGRKKTHVEPHLDFRISDFELLERGLDLSQLSQ